MKGRTGTGTGKQGNEGKDREMKGRTGGTGK